MATLKIEYKNRELEIYEKDGQNMITIDLARINENDYQYLSMDITKQHAKQIIEFLQKQIEDESS